MPYIEAQDRNQMMMCSLDSMVDPESIARVSDRFVDGLDLKGMGLKKAEAAVEGRPSHTEQHTKDKKANATISKYRNGNVLGAVKR